jgi:hypothetical protein
MNVATVADDFGKGIARKSTGDHNMAKKGKTLPKNFSELVVC